MHQSGGEYTKGHVVLNTDTHREQGPQRKSWLCARHSTTGESTEKHK